MEGRKKVEGMSSYNDSFIWEIPVVRRDTEIRAREAGNEPPIFWRRRPLTSWFKHKTPNFASHECCVQ